METCTAYVTVLNGIDFGMTLDPRQACIHGAKEGLAEPHRP